MTLEFGASVPISLQEIDAALFSNSIEGNVGCDA